MSLYHVAIAVDQLINTCLSGYPDETLSSRAYRMDGRKKRWTIMRLVIDALFFWQDKHCYHSFLSEVARNHLPAKYRQ